VPGSTSGAQPTPEPRRPRWAATRGHGIRLVLAALDRHGPKGKRYPTQSTAADPQPTPARHCRARRTTRCKDSPTGRSPGPPDRAAPHRHRSQGETVSDSIHRCRSSADPGPPLPSPADHALQGLSRGPVTRPTPGAGDATPKLYARARLGLRRSSPLEHRHSDCTGSTVPPVNSDTPPRAHSARVRQAPTGRVTLTEGTAPLDKVHGPSTQPNTLAVKA
jgi:hypothetical protein